MRHLVFLAGRLVDTWSEPAGGSEYAGLARRLRLEQERLRLPPPPPVVPLRTQVERWLRLQVGGAAAVAALTPDPLDPDADDLALPTSEVTVEVRERLELAADLLGHVAEVHFDLELGTAARRALLRTHACDPTVVSGARSTAHLAGGVAWAVAKANGRLGTSLDGLPHAPAPVPAARVQEAVGLRGSPAAAGRSVQRALLGLRSTDEERPPPGSRVPHLLALGDPLLLTGATRSLLLRLREQVREAESVEAADT